MKNLAHLLIYFLRKNLTNLKPISFINALFDDILSNSDFSGGAAKAAFRLNCALNDNKKLNVNSKMRVLEKKTNEKWRMCTSSQQSAEERIFVCAREDECVCACESE